MILLQECNERCYPTSLPLKQKTIQCSNASRWDDTFGLVREDTKPLSKISGIIITIEIDRMSQASFNSLQGMTPKPIKTTNRLSVLGPQDETHF